MIHKYQFFTKILNRLSHEANRLWKYIPFERLSYRMVGSAPTACEFRAQVESILGVVSRELLSQINEKEKNAILRNADLTLSHIFDLLGSGPVCMPKIDWHTDFKSSYTWPKRYYMGLRSMGKKGADIKVPWELSRSHHLLWLSEAYLLTNNVAYAQEVVSEICDWIDENPSMFSVNWTCAMDVSIRAINWLYAVNMIWDSTCVTDEFISKLYKSLYQHGFYIYHNIEKIIPYSNNHYFSDLVGLLYIGQLFKHTKYGAKWWKFGLTEYYSEIRSQTLPSGANNERSISYHRLMTELASYPIYMLHRVGEIIPNDIIYRIGKMHEYIVDYTKQNGLAPLIGDNDDGRLLPFVKRDFRDHKYMIDKRSCESIIISANVVNDIISYRCEPLRIADYRDVGCVIRRYNDNYLYITNGERGRYLSNDVIECGHHSHADLLSFEMAIGEDDVFVDTGGYIYTSDLNEHTKFRSVSKHNTIEVDDEEQLKPTKKAFISRLNSVIKYIAIENNKVIKSAYSTLDGKMTHSRSFAYEDNTLVIEDSVSKTGDSHNLTLSLHLAPDVSVDICGDDILLGTQSYALNLSFFSKISYKIDVLEDIYSPSYGVKKISKVIKLSLVFADNVFVQTKISWRRKFKK